MASTTRFCLTAAAAALASAGAAEPAAATDPVEAAPDASLARPYVTSWRQLLPNDDGAFEAQGCFYETLAPIGDGDWLHIQVGTNRSVHAVIQETRVLDGESLRPRSVRRAILNVPDGAEGAPRWVDVRHDGARADGVAVLLDGTERQFERSYSGPVYDGWIAGVFIAALPLAQDYAATALVAIPLQDQEYRMNFAVVGQEPFELDSGESVQAWVVDAEWVDAASGDVTAGGRDEPGGAYLIAVEPTAGASAVLAYLNDGVQIVQGACG